MPAEPPMPQVTVQINSRAYSLSCEDGEEEHLRELAQYLDGHVSDLRARFGQVGDARLLVMASLQIADQFSEALTEVESLRDQVAALRDGSSEIRSLTAEIEDRAAKGIESVVTRMEALTRSLAED